MRGLGITLSLYVQDVTCCQAPHVFSLFCTRVSAAYRSNELMWHGFYTWHRSVQLLECVWSRCNQQNHQAGNFYWKLALMCASVEQLENMLTAAHGQLMRLCGTRRMLHIALPTTEPRHCATPVCFQFHAHLIITSV